METERLENLQTERRRLLDMIDGSETYDVNEVSNEGPEEAAIKLQEELEIVEEEIKEVLAEINKNAIENADEEFILVETNYVVKESTATRKIPGVYITTKSLLLKPNSATYPFTDLTKEHDKNKVGSKISSVSVIKSILTTTSHATIESLLEAYEAKIIETNGEALDSNIKNAILKAERVSKPKKKSETTDTVKTPTIK